MNSIDFISSRIFRETFIYEASAVFGKIFVKSWHMISRQQPSQTVLQNIRLAFIGLAYKFTYPNLRKGRTAPC